LFTLSSLNSVFFSSKIDSNVSVSLKYPIPLYLNLVSSLYAVKKIMSKLNSMKMPSILPDHPIILMVILLKLYLYLLLPPKALISNTSNLFILWNLIGTWHDSTRSSGEHAETIATPYFLNT
jgi:hypothetical protein